MDQKVLKVLLEEAANSGCSNKRRTAIECQLRDATAAGDGVEVESQAAGLELLLNTLFNDVIKNRPELLPMLFPTFAVICGDREEGDLTTKVDWSLID